LDKHKAIETTIRGMPHETYTLELHPSAYAKIALAQATAQVTSDERRKRKRTIAPIFMRNTRQHDIWWTFFASKSLYADYLDIPLPYVTVESARRERLSRRFSVDDRDIEQRKNIHGR
jgi:hypothetical protein